MKTKAKPRKHRPTFWYATTKAIGVYVGVWAAGSMIERLVVNPTVVDSSIRTAWVFGGLLLVIGSVIASYKLVFAELARAQFKPRELAKRLVAALVLAEATLLAVTTLFGKLAPSNDVRSMQAETQMPTTANIIGAIFLLLLPYIAFKMVLYILAKNRAERERTELFK